MKTLEFSLFVTCLAGAVIMLFLSLLKKHYPATIYWAVGNAVCALAFSLLSVKLEFPFHLSMVLANLLAAFGLLIIYLGIVNFAGRPRTMNITYYLVGILFVLYLYFTYIENNPAVQSMISAIAAAALMLVISTTLFMNSPKALRFSHWSAGFMFLLMGLFELFHGITLIFNGTEPGKQMDSWVMGVNASVTVAFAVVWVVASVFMVTQRLSVELAETARVDYLTKTLNRRAAQERLHEECKYCERKGSYFSIILIDLDRFKEINDHHGHTAGDAVLEQLSDIMRRNLRAEDMHSRWGGDEFLIMLKDTAEAGAMEVAQRISQAVKIEKVSFKGKFIECSLSAGIACYVQTLRNLEETIIRADEALYEAKAKGGNTIILESDLPST